MIETSVHVDATDAVLALARFAARAPGIGADAALDTAAQVAGAVRSTVPHRSGALASSVSAEKVTDEARLSVGVEYAGWVIYGGTRGRPYVAEGRWLGPALVGADRDFARRAERGLDAAGRRL